MIAFVGGFLAGCLLMVAWWLHVLRGAFPRGTA